MKLYQILEKQIKKEPNYVSDNGEIKKWVVLNKAQNFDEELIGLLLEDADLKEKFFLKVKDAWVFKQNLFIRFLEQKNYLNDSYTQFKNKVGLTIDGKHLKQRNEVSLVWPFKDCILEGGQSREEDKREEIFFNEVLAQDEITELLDPKVLTNAKRFDNEGEHSFDQFNRNENGTITDNLIIKGNNLLALYSLKKEFAGKVKLIYIDPPYNTGNDGFKYNDSFNHSTWLTFMKNRLLIARELLRKDGIIAIQCDDNEQAYLKILMDEIYGRRNNINTIIPEMSNMSGPKIEHAIQGRKFPKVKEYIHIYANNKEYIKLKIPKVSKEKWDAEYNMIISNFDLNDYNNLKGALEKRDAEFAKKILEKRNIISLNSFIKQNNILQTKDWLYENSYRILASKPNKALRNIASKNIFSSDIAVISSPRGDLKIIKTDFNRETPTARIELSFAKDNLEFFIGDIWLGISTTGGVAQEGGVVLMNGKKPEDLLKIILESMTEKNDIVLDYHLGSGTTAAVAHKMQRQYIGIEQLNYGENDSITRLQNVIKGDKTGISKSVNWQGGGCFIYLELKKYNQTFIEKIEEAENEDALLQIWEEMKAKSFLNYNVDIRKQEQHIEHFKALSLTEQKQHLCELLDKNQLYVNLSSLGDRNFECSPEEQKVTQAFYQLKN
ncbi:site-specific DNA-methyltransferase [Chryseobacterium flavum]|uniref:site-specific DNA-methyltransferase n=1 Tax=Chryseobacterium flavum TaxID=415851 RepID=UPI0028A74AA7|nr:site-specific DNA-methyltransferase [Chryseobacterium flavum]